MSALVITAVDHTTGQFTSVAHGHITGDGLGLLFAGVGGALPAGLSPTSGLYFIRVDADHFKLADSSAHALAGTALTFTGNGTLPLSLGIGVPYQRSTNYIPGVQIKSADLNALQDMDTALWALLSGQAQSFFAGIALANQNITLTGTSDIKRTFELPVAPISALYGGSASYDQTNRYAINSGAAIVTMQIDGLKVGDIIRNVDFNHYGNASAYSSVFTLNKVTSAGVASVVATSGSVSTPTGIGWSTYTLVVGSPVAVASGDVWFIEWSPSSAVQRLQGANVKGDRG
jgi:hypothetical protein